MSCCRSAAPDEPAHRAAGDIEAKLMHLGYALPPPFVFPSANRRGCSQVGNVLLLSGHGLGLPALAGVRQSGRLGADMTVEEGYATARAVALTMLATIKAHCGDLDRVHRVLRLFGMVRCTPEFTQHARVIDGASDLLLEIWGPDRGQHARSAVGMAALPQGIAVEINGELELVRPDASS